jgi:hypothetical protein
MKYLKVMLLVGIFLKVNSVFFAQSVCGAEIEKRYFYPTSQRLQMRIQVCRSEPPVDHILFDWGDGYMDTVPRYSTLNAGGGYIIDLYFTEHYYDVDTAQYVELKLHAGMVIDDFANVDYTMDTNFVLTDSFYVYSEEYSPHLGIMENFGPRMEYLTPTTYTGIEWDENMLMYQMPPEIDLLTFSRGEFPVVGYTPPAPIEELYVEGGIMYWEYPLEPGKYAVAGKVRELKYTDNPLYQEPLILVSTITKAFMIIVDSASLVTTVPAIEIDKVLSIYPNPTTTTTTLEYGGLSGEIHLKAINAQGQIMLQKTLNSTAQLQREVIDLSTWPAGVYWIELRNKAGQVTKKLVVE